MASNEIIDIFEKRRQEERLRQELVDAVKLFEELNPEYKNKDLVAHIKAKFRGTTYEQISTATLNKIKNGTFAIKDKRGQRNFDDDQHIQLVCIFKFLGEFGVAPTESVQVNVANNFLKINDDPKKRERSVGRSWFRSFNNLFKDNLRPDHVPANKLINPDLSKFSGCSDGLVAEWGQILSNAVLESRLGTISPAGELEIVYPDCIFTTEAFTLQGTETKRDPIYLPVGSSANDAELDVLYNNDGLRCTTGIFSSTLSGKFLKPLICLPKRSISEDDSIEGTDSVFLTANGSGWVTGKVYVNFVKTYLLKKMKEHAAALPEGTKPLLLYNSHGSHCTIEILKYFVDNGVTVVTFPVNAVSSFSPLENHFFASFLDKFNKTILNHSGDATDLRAVTARVQAIQRDKMFLQNLLQNSWRSVGFVKSQYSNVYYFKGQHIVRTASEGKTPPSRKRKTFQEPVGGSGNQSSSSKLPNLNMAGVDFNQQFKTIAQAGYNWS